MKKIKQENVDAWVAKTGQKDSEALLAEHLPQMAARLTRVDLQLTKLLQEIRAVFPNAKFYTSGGDRLCLILGDSHDSNGLAQQQRVAWDGRAAICGGDW